MNGYYYMKRSLHLQLSLMMFLEFFMKGSWFVTLGTYLKSNLGASPLEVSSIFSTQSLGAVAAPFLIGFIADRFFNAERVMGVLHLIGAGLLLMMYRAENVAAIYPYVLLYFIAYMSTLALTSSVSFRNLSNPKKQYPLIRLFGTAGWMIAGFSISYVFHWDTKEAVASGALQNTFLLGAACSLALGLLCFLLPATPPLKKDQPFYWGDALGLQALKLLKQKSFLVFFITAIIICIPISFYYQHANPFLVATGLPNPTAKMALGQLSEILCLLLVPVLFARLGYKKMMLIGIGAWALRYLLFAYGNGQDLAFMLILGILLHGVCYDFMFVVGQIYTDTIAGKQYRSSAQGLVTVAMYGIGMLIGFWVAGFVSDALKAYEGTVYWRYIWLSPAAMAIGCMLIFLLLFKEQQDGATETAG
ncbi:nucleoside transporter [Niabella drilacis]|uniref:Nucleoside transporter n=2 Tax=Niabella drilacis (strain DSM 25811 / CCM 8410 / CCUG 62505 / LMG 26954 / E90) TaxID=1285928 RepID=A0A1G6S2F0_NIADE|nr:nucleoside transporter [Niabella drilacis]